MGKQEIIVNGKRLTYSGDGISGRELMEISDGGNYGRRTVIRTKGIEFRKVNSGDYYGKHELVDRRGKPVQVKSIPDRTKGISYGRNRSELSRKIIEQQVYDVAANLFKDGVDFDDRNADWFVAPRYHLPKIWGGRTTPLLIVFPSEFPEIPPVGFYVKGDLGISPNGHLYDEAYHDAYKEPLKHGWKWYCAFVNNGSWLPARIRRVEDWRQGDNLWTYLTLVNEVLGGAE